MLKNKKGIELATGTLVKIIILIVAFAIIGAAIIYLLRHFGVI